MYARSTIPRSLSALALAQDGVLTRVQVLAHLGREPVRRLLRSGEWSRVTPGVYVTAPAPGLRQRLWAGHLVGGAGSALGGRAALAASGILEEANPVEVWLPAGVRRERRPGFAFRVDGLGRLDRTTGSLPVIRLEEALLDLGASLGVADWVALASDALRTGRVSLGRLRTSLGQRGRIAQRPLLASVIADLEGVESPLEFRYLREVERAHGLPRGRRQVSVLLGTRSDLLYEEWGVIIELDGRIHVATRFRDMARDNANSVCGRLTLRYGSADVYGSPCAVAAQVAEALAVRGWTGALRPCPQCPR